MTKKQYMKIVSDIVTIVNNYYPARTTELNSLTITIRQSIVLAISDQIDTSDKSPEVYRSHMSIARSIEYIDKIPYLKPLCKFEVEAFSKKNLKEAGWTPKQITEITRLR